MECPEGFWSFEDCPIVFWIATPLNGTKKKAHTPQIIPEILVFAPQGNVHDRKYKDKTSNVFWGAVFGKGFLGFQFWSAQGLVFFFWGRGAY